MRNYLLILLLFNSSCELVDNIFSPEQKNTYINQCLISYTHNYEKLLSKEELSLLFVIEKDLINMDTTDLNKTHTYTWKSSADALTNSYEWRNNYITIESLIFFTESQLKYFDEPSSINYFDHHYQPIDTHEYQLLLDNLSKSFNSEEEDFIKRKTFLKQRLNKEFILLENLGDRAYWFADENATITLIILKEEAALTLKSNTSDHLTEGLDHAIQVAKLILSKC